MSTRRCPSAWTGTLNSGIRIPLLLLLLLLPASALLAQKRAITLDDYYLLESVSSPTIAPDGRWVAYLRNVTVEAENRRRTELWLVAADGSGSPRRLSDRTVNATEPRWSPDGKLLSFSATRRSGNGTNTETGIWLLRMDRLSEPPFRLPGLNETPIWSPDGKWIAFTRATPPNGPAAPALSAADQKLQQRFTGRIAEWMNYRFDGRGYLPDPRDPSATPPKELYLLAAAGGTPRRLTTLGVDVRDVAWRPDGAALAFVADTHQRDEHSYERADLFTVTLDGRVTRLTDDGYDHGAPVWSPDGRWLVFGRQMGLTAVIAASQDHGAALDIYRMPSNGGEMVNLTASWDQLPGNPAVSPDSRFVYFSGGLGGATHLFRVPIDGGATEQVTEGARRLGSFSFSARWDRVAFTGTDPSRPAELYSARLDGSQERRLTGLNDRLLGAIEVRPTDRIEFPSRDGTPIEGWVITPSGYTPAGTRYPVVLAIHGGPHGAYGNDFSFQFQYWAANGYLVLFTNPRGSTGYGEPFLWGTWGGWGNRDGGDVLAGVDYVVSHYAADPERLGVTGYSYGGFLTNWLITQTPRFKAAVVGAGISNWLSDYGTADIPRTKESEFYGPPWQERGAATLWAQSPVRLAGQVKTPTLFVHGEADLRVPIEQAEQMYTALQKNRVPARLVRYPGMYHGGWSPWNTVHRYAEELSWWKRWLGNKCPTPNAQCP